jgi:F-type H+-transporting ATPase subunit epsilon
MSGFRLVLHDSTHVETVDGVTAFVAEDDSGSFGIRAGCTRTATVLTLGLARYRCGEAPWQYLALPRAVLYFNNDELTISTRHFLRGDDYTRISAAMDKELLAEEQQLRTMKKSLRHMEEEILRRMWEMGRAGYS